MVNAVGQTTNNFLSHADETKLLKLRILDKECKKDTNCTDSTEIQVEIDRLLALDSVNEQLAYEACDLADSQCQVMVDKLQVLSDEYKQRREDEVRKTGLELSNDYLQSNFAREEYEVNKLLGKFQLRQANAEFYNTTRGLADIGVETVNGTLDVASMYAKSTFGDPEAKKQVDAFETALKGFVEHPIDSIQESIKAELDTIDALESSGIEGDSEKARRLRSKLYGSIALSITGVGGVILGASKKVVGFKADGAEAKPNTNSLGNTDVNVSKFGTDLNNDVQARADSLIAQWKSGKITKADLNDRLVATSKTGVEDFNFKSRDFENLGGSGQFKANRSLPGVQKGADGNFTIVDREAYFKHVENLYESKDNPLNAFTKKLINNHLDKQNVNTFSTRDGLPGLHAEVQSVNDAFNFLSNSHKVDLDKFDLSKIKVSTYKLQGADGGAFEACSNCTNIISNPIDIITGRKSK